MPPWDKQLLKQPLIERLYGTEVEYGLLSAHDPNSKSGYQNLPRGLVSLNGFLSNGGRYYADCNHPEYATPECRTLDEVVAHEVAGEQILMHRALVLQFTGDKMVRLNKRNVDKGDGRPRYWGCHENYLTERSRFDFEGAAFRQAWLAHLATRSVFTGAGTLHRGQYRVAQKLGGRFVEENIIAHDPNARPLFDTRDEPLAADHWRRIQVSCGDANISPWALRMRLGTTALILRMFEHGLSPDDLALKKPVTAARTAAFDHTLQQKISLKNGKQVSPLEIQSQLARRARMLGELLVLPDEEYEVIDEWQRVCADLDKDPKLATDRVDWVARKAALERKKARLQSNWLHPDLEAHDLFYDQLGPEHGTGQRMRDRNWFAGMPSRAAIEQAMTTPPNTRAKLRGQLILVIVQEPELAADAHVTWEAIVVNASAERPHRFNLSNPYQVKQDTRLDKKNKHGGR